MYPSVVLMNMNAALMCDFLGLILLRRLQLVIVEEVDQVSLTGFQGHL